MNLKFLTSSHRGKLVARLTDLAEQMQRSGDQGSNGSIYPSQEQIDDVRSAAAIVASIKAKDEEPKPVSHWSLNQPSMIPIDPEKLRELAVLQRRLHDAVERHRCPGKSQRMQWYMMRFDAEFFGGMMLGAMLGLVFGVAVRWW